MDLLHNLAIGFQTALTLTNLFYALMGCLLGTLIGVLPGLGPVATIAMLLPSIYALDATPALIMLAGIYYGAQYGGSTTSVLVNIPGEATSVVTCLDGHQMARQGRAGPALAIAASLVHLGSGYAVTKASVETESGLVAEAGIRFRAMPFPTPAMREMMLENARRLGLDAPMRA